MVTSAGAKMRWHEDPFGGVMPPTVPPSALRLRTRHLVCCFIMSMVAGSLSACTPEIDGITGMTRDGRGRLVGIGLACSGELQGATLVRDANTEESKVLGRWVADSEEARFEWAMQEPAAPDGWEQWKAAPMKLVSGHRYTLVAWGEEHARNAESVNFTVDDLATIESGLIFTPDNSLVTEDDFRQRACEYYE